MKHVFGPVPSRRLGYSLGLDAVPPKVCSMDCVYCELGPTTERTVCRKRWVDVGAVLSDLEARLAEGPRVDTITISGSGEPTLNLGLGELIDGARRLSDRPIAVLTNAGLMTDPVVRDELLRADIVAPSLDAVTPELFQRINRPHPSLDPGEIAEAVRTFTRAFEGRVFLEIVFVRGMNDAPDEVERLSRAVADIDPDVVHVNTVVRPPAVAGVDGVSPAELQAIARRLGPRAEVIARPRLGGQQGSSGAESQLVEMASRRPVTLQDVSSALGLSRAEASKILGILVDRGCLELVEHDEKRYYWARRERGCQ
jgi:wyosine [tRNA(Phe)-imidazoG37] synthetase (radical SAM superfamily)